jgi:hypothetical protein
MSKTGILVYKVKAATPESIMHGTPVLAFPAKTFSSDAEVTCKYHLLSYYARSPKCEYVYIYCEGDINNKPWAWKCHFLHNMHYKCTEKEDYVCYGVIPFNKEL